MSLRDTILRDAALAVTVVAVAVQLAVAFMLPLTPEQAGEINAVAVALSGVLTAVLVAGDRLVPALLGLAQAGISLAIGLGVHLSPAGQAVVMTALSSLVGAFVRTQVTSRVPPPGSGVGFTFKSVPFTPATYTTNASHPPTQK